MPFGDLSPQPAVVRQAPNAATRATQPACPHVFKPPQPELNYISMVDVQSQLWRSWPVSAIMRELAEAHLAQVVLEDQRLPDLSDACS